MTLKDHNKQDLNLGDVVAYATTIHRRNFMIVAVITEIVDGFPYLKRLPDGYTLGKRAAQILAKIDKTLIGDPRILIYLTENGWL